MSIEFPDKLEYRAAYNGAINMLGKWFQWDHTQADYQDIPELNVEVAQLWSEVLAAATWEECMEFCARIIECLVNDADVQAAFSDFIAAHPGGTTYPKNQELPTEVTESNLSISNPDCDPDILWAQCIGFVQTANRMTVDFLETWETYTSSVETIPAIILSIPFLGEVADVLGIDGIASYANAILDSIREGYDADYTLEYENDLACVIFCASKDSCVVSLDEMVEIMNNRLSGQLTLTNGIELLLSLIDADITGINVADLYLCAFFNMLKLANLVLPITWGIESYLRVTRTFNTPNDDWEVLCEDCPPEDWITVDFSFGQQGWESYLGGTSWAVFDTDGFIAGSSSSIQLAIVKHLTGTITDVEVYMSAPLVGGFGTYVANYDVSSAAHSGDTTDLIVFTGLSLGSGLFVNPAWLSGSRKLTKIRYKIAP